MHYSLRNERWCRKNTPSRDGSIPLSESTRKVIGVCSGAETHPPRKFCGNLLCGCCVILPTNQPPMETGANTTSSAQIIKVSLIGIKHDSNRTHGQSDEKMCWTRLLNEHQRRWEDSGSEKKQTTKTNNLLLAGGGRKLSIRKDCPHKSSFGKTHSGKCYAKRLMIYMTDYETRQLFGIHNGEIKKINKKITFSLIVKLSSKVEPRLKVGLLPWKFL